MCYTEKAPNAWQRRETQAYVTPLRVYSVSEHVLEAELAALRNIA